MWYIKNMIKICCRCKKEKDISDFTLSTSSKDGYYPSCKKCNSEQCSEYQKKNREKRTNYFREYRKTENGYNNSYHAVVKYNNKNKEKLSAWCKLRNAFKEQCRICGSDQDIIRHHEDYSKPLEYICLCHLHHKEIHSNESMV